MSILINLQNAKTKKDLAAILDINTSTLTNALYRKKVSSLYTEFKIPKKKGGERTIYAPQRELKIIQKKLSLILQDCLEEITSNDEKISNLSHGFMREKSIYTNATHHKNKKNVLNIDLKDFFDCFNFGRVRGFFIKNKNFELHQDIATVIAQIACYNNSLPQGSPCSPIISNLITHSLDIKLSQLASRYSCFYTRYADDITFSTRECIFPTPLARIENNEYVIGKKLRQEITRSGFEINTIKTRIQYLSSRQDVTGLIVNKKVNVKKEYWKSVRAKCDFLFKNGYYYVLDDTGKEIKGSLSQLYGQLNFIDQIDYLNKLKKPIEINPLYILAKHGNNKTPLFSSRERVFSHFLFYKSFYGNENTTVICEGKTDIIYIRCAIKSLYKSYPSLVDKDGIIKFDFFKYTRRTRYLLSLHGGTTYIADFIKNYRQYYSLYKAAKPTKPVIIILDNDNGLGDIIGGLQKERKPRLVTADGETTLNGINSLKKSLYVHVCFNLYLLIVPHLNQKETSIESLFDKSVLDTKLNGKSFTTENEFSHEKFYGKHVFATAVIENNKHKVDFSGFNQIFKAIEKIQDDYKDVQKNTAKPPIKDTTINATP
ncbi:ribonuclease H [Aeromonas hydrophila]|uniref:retron Ec67 family RNA-directed DNA polymerase/endonuclease n=1 Tax=Aeromonas hydrophila TaxID=644 RepID=UPI001C5BE67A|nr:ribonuclease H [Aeromonas hydrophila]MBW3800076.1 ribonuclease H [Aeromonas hydrophila]MBW3819312.1 ribonuclease H [Aeromonas hydrophila]